MCNLRYPKHKETSIGYTYIHYTHQQDEISFELQYIINTSKEATRKFKGIKIGIKKANLTSCKGSVMGRSP